MAIRSNNQNKTLGDFDDCVWLWITVVIYWQMDHLRTMGQQLIFQLIDFHEWTTGIEIKSFMPIGPRITLISSGI